MRLLRAAVLSAVLTLVGATAVAVATPADSSPVSDPGSLPIIQIHGFDSQDCPGSDASYGWAPFDYVLHRAGWTGPLLPVSFYACDTDGADITGYGADTPAEIGTQLSPDPPRAGYHQDASFVTIARDLAWYVYRNFSVAGQAVDIVALSMGGLIARTALHRVQVGDPTFPPLLRVAQAITFSTPHLGFGTMASNGEDPGCHHMLQCEEWGKDSPLLTELVRDGTDPQGTGGTQWTVIGSSAGCDFLPLDSALGLPHALQIDLTAPCYSHVGYFWDIEPEPTATAVIKNGADATPETITDAPHSLTLATILLQNPRPDASPVPTPPPAGAPPTVTATTIDDRAFQLSSGWVRLASSGSFGKTLSRARTAGATASATVRAARIELLVTTCPGCGSLQVSIGGDAWRTVSTRSTRTTRQAVLRLATWSSERTVRVRLRTTSSKPVYLDGLTTLR